MTRRAWTRASVGRFHAGISRDLQARLETSQRGRLVASFVDANRADIARLLLKDGDVRRATVAALRPLVAGATTTTDVLERVFTATDLKRLDALAGSSVAVAAPSWPTTLQPVRRLAKTAEGRSAAEILGIKLEV